MKVNLFRVTLVSMFALSACVSTQLVSPMVTVTKRAVDDHQIGCVEIANQLTALQSIRKHAENGHSVPAHNIAATRIFQQSTPRDALNINEAVAVVNKREMTLVKMAAQRSCKLTMQSQGPAIIGNS